VLQYLLSSIYRPVNNDIEITGRVATMMLTEGVSETQAKIARGE
jgi:hypothetical protein